MTRTITTPEELGALPDGSVLLDQMGDAGTLSGDRIYYPETAPMDADRALRKYGPLRLLHDPSVPAPDPDARVVLEAALGDTK